MNSGCSLSSGSAGQSAGASVHQLVPPVVAPAVHRHRLAGAAARRRRSRPTGRLRSASSTFAFSGTTSPRRQPPSAVITHLRLGVVDAVAQRLGAEAAEDHAVRRADAGAGEHGDGQLRGSSACRCRRGRPASTPRPLEHVGELADLAVQLVVGERARLSPGSPSQMIAALLRRQAVEVPVEAVVARRWSCRRRTTWRTAASTRGRSARA